MTGHLNTSRTPCDTLILKDFAAPEAEPVAQEDPRFDFASRFQARERTSSRSPVTASQMEPEPVGSDKAGITYESQLMRT